MPRIGDDSMQLLLYACIPYTAPDIFDGLSGKVVAIITTPTMVGTIIMIIAIAVMILIIGGIIFKCKRRPDQSHTSMSYSERNVTNGDGHSFNNSINEVIATDLEFTVYENTAD